jgi:glycine/D-amino acid oxidase-like deaminating enzyme
MNGTDTLATADVVVVGAGLVGLCTAWELRNVGFDVVVVEQRFPGYGASSRNPGMIWVQTRRAGLELELARAGRAKYEEYRDVLGDVFHYRTDGGILFFETNEQGAVVEDYVRDRRAAGVDIRMLGRDEARKFSPVLPQTAIGGAYSTEDAQIDPLSFLSALDDACLRRGIRLFRNTAVLSTLRDRDETKGVRTVRGEIHAQGVVWATGAWAKTLQAEGIWAPVESSRVGQLMTQPVESRPSPILHGPRGVHYCGALRALPSFRRELFAAPGHASEAQDGAPSTLEYDDTIGLNRGGSLYVGHSIDGYGSLNPHISLRATHAMINLAAERYGAYAGSGVTGLWAGLASETADQLPVVGAVDGVFVSTGHSWGVASGPACGQVLARVISGEQSPYGAGLSAERPTLESQLHSGV